MILICIYIGILLSYFINQIIYCSDDPEHGMFYVLQAFIIFFYCVIGIFEYMILNTLLLRKQGK